MALAKPKSVAIVGMGYSHADYLASALINGKTVDEVWGINAIGGVIQCDRIFMMDRVDTLWEHNRFSWIKEHQVPIYTSQVVDCGANLIEYPLAEIVNKFKSTYFSNTVPYAIAYALYIGVEEINLFGLDYNYADKSYVETGRGGTEFWLGIAYSLGVKLNVAQNSTLLGTNERKFYGYAPLNLRDENGTIIVEMSDETEDV